MVASGEIAAFTPVRSRPNTMVQAACMNLACSDVSTIWWTSTVAPPLGEAAALAQSIEDLVERVLIPEQPMPDLHLIHDEQRSRFGKSLVFPGLSTEQLVEHLHQDFGVAD